MWVALRSAENPEMQLSRNCAYCVQKKVAEKQKRDCYAVGINPHAKREHLYAVPLINIDGIQEKTEDRKPATITKRANKRAFEDILAQVSSKLPGKSTYTVWDSFFDEVCPTAFIDEVMSTLMNTEATISEYKGAVGNLYEDSNRTALLGFYMDYADFIEAMDIIRGAKASYMEHQRQIQEAKAQSQNAGTKSNIIE